MLHNPSHLEAQNAVSMGKTRAKQDDYKSFDKAINVQVHGDAAFVAQGIVYEGMALTKVQGILCGWKRAYHLQQPNRVYDHSER